MSMDLKVQTYEYAPEYLIADNSEINTAVKVASVAMQRGTVVALNDDDKLELLVVDGEPDSYTVDTTKLYGVVADDVEANKEAVVYLTGGFFGDALKLPENATIAHVEVPLRKLGIFVK